MIVLIFLIGLLADTTLRLTGMVGRWDTSADNTDDYDVFG